MNNTQELNIALNQKKEIIEGAKDGLAIGLGYFPVGMAFGIMAKSASLTIIDVLGLSFIVFAGASQFMAVGMMSLGVSGLEIIITTLFLNFRHFLMSSSLLPRMSINHKKLKPLIAFFVTDESFSVASFRTRTLTEYYLLPMEIIAYLGWGTGSVMGFLLGSILPETMQLSMGIGLYAMFVALLVPKIKTTHKALVISFIGAISNIFCQNILSLAPGWSIVISIILASGIGVVMYDTPKETDENEATDNTCLKDEEEAV